MKKTKIIPLKIKPFNNRTEYTQWQERNCHLCKQYENKSTKLEKANCSTAHHIDLSATTDGKIPLSEALKIGTNLKTFKLPTLCKKKS